jgi:hypothetical protein
MPSDDLATSALWMSYVPCSGILGLFMGDSNAFLLSVVLESGARELFDGIWVIIIYKGGEIRKLVCSSGSPDADMTS